MRSWRFGALEVREVTFGCCKCFFVFFVLFECCLDAKGADLLALRVERLV